MACRLLSTRIGDRHSYLSVPTVHMRQDNQYSPIVGPHDPSGEDDYLAREARARKEIDRQLAAAGWKVQSQKTLNVSAGPGWRFR